MNDSLKMLYDEHQIIVNVIDLANKASSLIGKDNDKYERVVKDLIRFFRIYADEFHHQKEEMILFPEMAKRNELAAEGVIHEMFENHKDFREIVSEIETNLYGKNYSGAQKLIGQYTSSLLDHIAAENEEVFPMAETLMNETELENIYFRFRDSDRELGEQRKESFVALAESIRKLLM